MTPVRARPRPRPWAPHSAVLPGTAAAVHDAAHLPGRGADALTATAEPRAYAGRGMPVLGLDR